MSEEIRDNETRSPDNCGCPHPPHDCCGCKPEKPAPVPNQCNKECCDPKEVECGDINNATCIPILSHRIYDCICLENEQMRYLKDVLFTIKTNKGYEVGDEICIEKILVKYDCIGLTSNPLPVVIDNLPPVNFTPSSESPICDCIQYHPIYSIYKGHVVTDLKCCDEGRKTKIVEPNLEFWICGLKIKVVGKIGCKPFIAETTEYNGKLFDFPSAGNGFKNVDFFGRICLPVGRHRVKFEEIFEGCISADCITPTQTYDDHTFTADILATLLINKTIYATVKEELVVYTTPNGIVCNKWNISSSCESTCE
ncbi:hypothetical protein [Romboutsia sp.]|uniref:hypothetical protein n=1 Tax=Romboutsia sp. TaxID=1965302 RepID=UPI002CA1CD67|nr:hypothetical protein [Romboutsia sp.]HSQ88735.1 hypothetical protein [Romboutsia sp.]